MSNRIFIEVPVEFGATAVSYDPHFDLVLIVTANGTPETHMMFVFSDTDREAILEAVKANTTQPNTTQQ